MTASLRQWTVDAFASAPFRGNPACVVEPFDVWPDAAWMQALAMENNQAETAFLLRTSDPARFGLRWFTPSMEVPLCGHATLASGHVLLIEHATWQSPRAALCYALQMHPALLRLQPRQQHATAGAAVHARQQASTHNGIRVTHI